MRVPTLMIDSAKYQNGQLANETPFGGMALSSSHLLAALQFRRTPLDTCCMQLGQSGLYTVVNKYPTSHIHVDLSTHAHAHTHNKKNDRSPNTCFGDLYCSHMHMCMHATKKIIVKLNHGKRDLTKAQAKCFPDRTFSAEHVVVGQILKSGDEENYCLFIYWDIMGTN